MKKEEHNHQESDLPAGLAAPARRALAGAGIQRLDQLTTMTEAEIRELHGIGANAIGQLGTALSANGLSFADEK
ncbi:MAG: DNA-binding protein [Chloroflexota bacterium]